jgi:hypothetical protein
VQIPASCWSVQERNRRFLTFSLSVSSNIAAAVSGEPRGFKVGVKGEGTGGVYPSRWEPGAVPPEKFSSYRCMQASLSHFQTKINTLTPAFMPVNVGKVPNPFDF